MLNKVTGLARAVGVLLAVVAGFVAIPNLDVNMTLVALGIVAGITMPDDRVSGVGISTLALPAVATAVGGLPALGAQLGAVAGGWAALAAGAFGCAIAIRVVKGAIDALTGLAK